MCGIIAYVGYPNTLTVFHGMLDMIDRGHDSWGYAEYDNGHIDAYWKLGQITPQDEFATTSIAIGHTRWATQGAVNLKNAHPLLSNNKQIAVVHNGDSNNLLKIKKQLEADGYLFYSDNDSEAIPNLIEYYMEHQMDFPTACREALGQIEGSFAIAAMNVRGKVAAAHRGLGLSFLSLANKEFIVASEMRAVKDLEQHMNENDPSIRMGKMDDNEMVIISPGNGLTRTMVYHDKIVPAFKGQK